MGVDLPLASMEDYFAVEKLFLKLVTKLLQVKRAPHVNNTILRKCFS